MNISFGEFICNIREKKGISLREFSKTVGISSSYESSIEKGKRSAPKYDILIKMSDILELNQDERECLFDLAAKSKNVPMVAYDLAEYINNNKFVHNTLRLAKKHYATEKDWKQFSQKIIETHD